LFYKVSNLCVEKITEKEKKLCAHHNYQVLKQAMEGGYAASQGPVPRIA